MLNRPNPLILVMGGGSLLTCSTFVFAAKIALWMKYAGALALVALGVASIVAGLVMAYRKKPEPPPRPKRKRREVDLDPATKARDRSA